ncbi:hypothetical protein [Candidatus Uabimicrobium sp. HlEnr_7]|uniref:hypothetical protein n=1 Tax=Candidatus Uabimicrobium helgolandensis TaxID=3095367 RepID=UPI0035586A0D
MRLLILMLLLLNITIYSQEQPQQNPQEEIVEKNNNEGNIEKDNREQDDEKDNREQDDEKDNREQDDEKDNREQDDEKDNREQDDEKDNREQDDEKDNREQDDEKDNREQDDEKDSREQDDEKKHTDNKNKHTDSATKQNAKTVKRQSIIVIGKLSKTKPLTMKKPSEYVLEDEMLYKTTDYYVGNLNIHSSKKRDLSHLENKVVMVYGYLEKDLNKIIEVIGECPQDYGENENQEQMRADWVDEETGFTLGRSSSEVLKKVSYVRYHKIQKCKGFRAKKYFGSKKVEIIFYNHLRKSIPDLKLIAHYESVFGKPVPMYQDKKINHLSPGDKASFVIPMTISSIKKYRLHSVKACADTTDLHIDINELIEGD